jgi:cellulase/cellobiase CelA1
VTKRTSVPEKTTTKPRTAKPTATKTTTRPRTDDFAATVSLGASWEQGYVATVRVRNTGSAATAWKVTVSHSGQENLRLTGVWNARGTQSGDNIAFTGDRLAPGASVQFGYQVSKSGRGNAKPSGCSVVGGKCSVG